MVLAGHCPVLAARGAALLSGHLESRQLVVVRWIVILKVEWGNMVADGSGGYVPSFNSLNFSSGKFAALPLFIGYRVTRA